MTTITHAEYAKFDDHELAAFQANRSKTMSKRLLINIRINSDPTAPDALSGFPFIGEQCVIDEAYGDACVVEIDLAGRDDTTVAQEQYLDTNPAIIGYSIEAGDLHDEK